jgi:hypothetical protein
MLFPFSWQLFFWQLFFWQLRFFAAVVLLAAASSQLLRSF